MTMIKYLNLSDKELFGNDAGEDEKPEILSSYFIMNPRFSDFENTDNTLCVARARKGMGKSTLLSKMSYDIANSNSNLVIKTTGDNLLGLGSFDSSDHTYLMAYWKQIICKRIINEIGTRIGFALSDNAISMVELAEIEGYKGRNLLTSLLTRLGVKAKLKYGDQEVSFEKTSLPPINPTVTLQTFQNSHSNSKIWIFIDDIDATFSGDEKNIARVSSFLGACRSLCTDMKNLYVRATIRSDVWTAIRHVEYLDKCEQYMVDIKWSRSELRNILANRILSFLHRKHSGQFPNSWTYQDNWRNLLSLTFTETITWDRREVPPYVPIQVLSGGRPRWMGQLCRIAGALAREPKIGTQEINQAMTPFGQNRIADLLKEHKYQFKDLQLLIDAFTAGKREYDVDELFSRINTNYVMKVGTDNVPLVDGYKYSKLSQLCQFLFGIGFIAGNPKGTMDYFSYEDHPDLFESEQLNKTNINWCIHPCYRSAIRII